MGDRGDGAFTHRFGKRGLGWTILGLAMVGSFAFLAIDSSGQTLKGDEWGYANRLASQNVVDTALHPAAGKYLLLFPLLLLKGLHEAFGIDSYLPYRVVGIGLVFLTATLTYLLVRRRTGSLVALPFAILPLFLGAGAVVIASSGRLPAQLALVAGLGMFLALDRDDSFGDIAGGALLLIALGSHPIAIPFAVAGAVQIALRPSRRLGLATIALAVPISLFAGWYLLVREADRGGSLASRLADAPDFALDYLIVIGAAVTGAFREPLTASAVDYFTALSVAGTLVIVALIAAPLLRRESERSPVWWALVTALILMLLAPALSSEGAESPTAERYIYPGAVLLLTTLGVSLSGWRLQGPSRRVAMGAGAVVFATALVVNAVQLHKEADGLQLASEYLRAKLGALELAEAYVEPTFQLEEPAVSPLVTRQPFKLEASEYFRVIDDFDSPAFEPGEIAQSPEPVRQAADLELIRALGIASGPAGGPPDRPGAVTELQRCLQLSSESSETQVELPSGEWTVSLTKGRGPVKLRLAAFADRPVAPAGVVDANRSVRLDLPSDVAASAGSALSWRLQMLGGGTLRICAERSRT